MIGTIHLQMSLTCRYHYRLNILLWRLRNLFCILLVLIQGNFVILYVMLEIKQICYTFILCHAFWAFSFIGYTGFQWCQRSSNEIYGKN